MASTLEILQPELDHTCFLGRYQSYEWYLSKEERRCAEYGNPTQKIALLHNNSATRICLPDFVSEESYFVER
jgi:hypothetical protein